MKTDYSSIIESWLPVARSHSPELVRGFWLLLDFCGDCMSPKYYKTHAAEAMEVLKKLDVKKEQAKMVYDYLMPIVGKYV